MSEQSPHALHELSAPQLVEGYRRRDFSPVDVTQSVLGRILGFGSITINTRGDDQIVANLISGAPQASHTIMALKNSGV